MNIYERNTDPTTPSLGYVLYIPVLSCVFGTKAYSQFPI